MSDSVRPFRIAIPDAVLTDLRQRLHATRWPDAELVDDWSQGAPLAWIQDSLPLLGRHLRLARTRGAAEPVRPVRHHAVDGLDVHFIHQRSPHPQARPLLITHGWPGSIVEFHKVIGPLTDPTAHGGSADDAFHVDLPVAARLRLFGQAHRHRLGRRAHRRRPGPR
jgi:hypothetical protein